jgi:Sporulation and spore germination
MAARRRGPRFGLRVRSPGSALRGTASLRAASRGAASRGAAVLAVAVMVVAGTAGCGIPTDDGPESVAVPPELTPIGGSPEPTTTLQPQQATTPRTVYLVNGARLQRVERQLPADEAFNLDVMEALAAGPTEDDRAAGTVTAIPVGTQILRATLDGTGIMTVDLNEAFRAVQGEQRNLATAQIVYTATDLPASNSVRFQENGQWIQLADAAGTLQRIDANGVPEPLSRVDFLPFVSDG